MWECESWVSLEWVRRGSEHSTAESSHRAQSAALHVYTYTL